jgi:hypothetical protein
MPSDVDFHSLAAGRWGLATACAVVASSAAIRAVYGARGSTAVPASLWAVAACGAFALDCALRAAGIVTQPAAAAALRLATTAIVVCPAMSLLGAKRPQHGVWQLIVGTLAVILALPALSTSLARPGSVADVHLLGRLFLVLLAVVGWMNFVATSNGLAATFILVGQFLVVRGFLPWVDSESAFPPAASPAAALSAAWDASAACALACGGLLAWIGAARTKRSAAGAGTFAAAVDPALLALRETLGAAWALRIAERFDGIATARGWPCRLGFQGIRPADAPFDGPWQHDARRALAALLCRFVTPAWLARHQWPLGDRAKLARRWRAR